jgi:hypothetical protein
VVGHPIEGGQTTTVGLEPPQTGWLKPPMAIGGGSATPKAQTKKFKKKKKKSLHSEGGRTTPKGHGMVRPPFGFLKYFLLFYYFNFIYFSNIN